jgi:ssDNA-specific exonuclease RecJ
MKLRNKIEDNCGRIHFSIQVADPAFPNMIHFQRCVYVIYSKEEKTFHFDEPNVARLLGVTKNAVSKFIQKHI